MDYRTQWLVVRVIGIGENETVSIGMEWKLRERIAKRRPIKTWINVVEDDLKDYKSKMGKRHFKMETDGDI